MRSKLKFKTTAVCPKCGKILVTESAYNDYPLQCLSCDEDFYFMETDVDEYQTHVYLPLKENDNEVEKLFRSEYATEMKHGYAKMTFHDFRLLESIGWVKDHVEIRLEDLLEEEEKIQKYVLVNDPYATYECIMDKESSDLGAALEDTLHRLLDEGADRERIYEITGMFHEDGNEESLRFCDVTSIDLGYYIEGISGLINE